MPVYHAPAEGALIQVELDELTALFHRPAGATHLLAEPAPQLLAALADGPADLDGLMSRLSGKYDVAAGERPSVAAHLQDLVAAGLVTVT